MSRVRLMSAWIILLSLLVICRPTEAEEFNIKAKAAVLMDPESGRVLFAQNERQRLPPASVTKVMTMLLIMEAVDSGRVKWDDKIPTSATAAGIGGSQVYLKEGETFTLHEMFKAIAVVSANDASTAVAEYLYGSGEDFIAAMNKRAQQLGLKNTHFANETGLPDPNHYSSAYDLAVISRELLKHHKILEYTSIRKDSLRDGRFVLYNTNDLIKVYPGADGLKTGHTAEAKFCLAATAKRDNLRLLSVILGAASNAERVAQTRRLLDYGFRTYERRVVRRKNATVGEIGFAEAQPAKVAVKVGADFTVLSERANAKPVITRLVKAENLRLPLAAGAKVGFLKAYQGETKLGQTPVYTTQPVKKANFLVLGWRALVNFIKNLLGMKVR
ncbi:MAG TPA: D-alanyl-D-alanine carboxypeptidase family protein [Bacillota bacterium]